MCVEISAHPNAQSAANGTDCTAVIAASALLVLCRRKAAARRCVLRRDWCPRETLWTYSLCAILSIAENAPPLIIHGNIDC